MYPCREVITCAAIWTLRNAKERKLLEYIKRRTEQAAAGRLKEEQQQRDEAQKRDAQEAARLEEAHAREDAEAQEILAAKARSDLQMKAEQAVVDLELAKAEIKTLKRSNGHLLVNLILAGLIIITIIINSILAYCT